MMRRNAEAVYGRKCARNEVDDYYGGIAILSALVHLPILLVRSLVGKRVILSDRFFQDFNLLDVRSMDKEVTLRDGWQNYLKLVPNVYAFVQLDAPAEVITSRKKEMSENNIVLYKNLIFEQYLHKPARLYIYINTALEREHCSGVIHENLKAVFKK